MLRLFTIRNGLIKEKTVLDRPFARDEIDMNNVHWIDAHEPTEEERDFLQGLVRTDIPESDEVEEIEASARCFEDQAGIHLLSLFLSQTEGRHATVSVAFILLPECLITIREGDLADFRLLRMRARRGQVACHSPSDLLFTILEQKVENLADILEDIHRRLETVSSLVLEEDNADLEQAIGDLARLENSNGKIRLCLMDTQREISFLLKHFLGEAELQETGRKTMRDVETLMSHTTFLFEKINFLMDSIQGFINIRQNQIIKIFSIAAVVFLPPTLVASIYGMNFRYMPELDVPYGYPAALALIVLSGIAPYVFFKRKGWLD